MAVDHKNYSERHMLGVRDQDNDRSCLFDSPSFYKNDLSMIEI